MDIFIDHTFAKIDGDERSSVFEVFPSVFKDGRGSFSEVLKTQSGWNGKNDMPLWFSNLDWIRQVNRSISSGGVIRGCHAQRGKFCQGKLVESVNGIVFDIITDARPDSKTFGLSKVYFLNPEVQNKLWVPRGFLHAFATPNGQENAIFMYFVDNTYDKSSEIGINPSTLFPKIVELIKENPTDSRTYAKFIELFDGNDDINYSEKDKNGLVYDDFMEEISSEYRNSGKVWYK